ncbi:hypothetical protein [Legionella parisiensis]|nr:hypothetical protein [Legionella parisiensis]
MSRLKKEVDTVKQALERQIGRMSSVIASGNKIRDFLGASSVQDYKRKTLENISSELQKVSIETLKKNLQEQAGYYIQYSTKKDDNSPKRYRGFFHRHGDTGVKRAQKFSHELDSANTIGDIFRAIQEASGGNYHQHSLNAYIARAMIACVNNAGLRMSGEKYDRTVGLVDKALFAPNIPEHDLEDFLTLAGKSIFIRDDYNTPKVELNLQ